LTSLSIKGGGSDNAGPSKGRTVTSNSILDGAIAHLESEVKKGQAAIKELKRIRSGAGEAATAPARRKRGRPKGSANWTPSDKLQREVMEFVEANPDGVTVKDTEAALPASKTAIDRTLRYLREEGVIRLAGRRGTANLFKPPVVVGSTNGGGR
jgi:Fic family protein